MSEKNKKAEEPENAPQPENERKLLYTMSLWKDIIPVYKCSQCEYSDESEDSMKLHVLKHFPQEQRDTILDKLVYLEQKKG